MSGSHGPIGRLGRWTATHFRRVAVAWALLAIGLGVFAPRVEHALAALVRLLLVPVAPRLLGKWAWWLPRPLGRLLPNVRFGHA